MRAAILASMVLALVGCSNEISGTLTVDGQAFAIAECFSGQRNGFVGVDFKGKDGRLLRVVMTPTGKPGVILFSGESVGAELGECGSFSIQKQNSTINDVDNVEGKVDLDCSGTKPTVKGSVTFKNCH